MKFITRESKKNPRMINQIIVEETKPVKPSNTTSTDQNPKKSTKNKMLKIQYFEFKSSFMNAMMLFFPILKNPKNK